MTKGKRCYHGKVWIHLTQVQVQGVEQLVVQHAGERVGTGVTTGSS
jgi:hypothetical protein